MNKRKSDVTHKGTSVLKSKVVVISKVPVDKRKKANTEKVRGI